MKAAQTAVVPTEEYLGAVREHLAIYGASPERVGQHLEEMAGHLSSTGASPIEEFGPPEVIANQLARADDLDQRRMVRMMALLLGMMGWGIAVALILGGTGSARLGGQQLGAVVTITLISAFAFSATGATFRDQLFGASETEFRTSKVRLGLMIGIVVGALAVSIAVEVLLGDRSIGTTALRSWLAGLMLVVLLVPVTWWAFRRNLGRPRFPAGSPLRASSLVRQIRVDGDHGYRSAMAGFQGLAPMVGTIVMILIAGQLGEPLDLVVLVGAIFVGPGWFLWLKRRR